LFLLQRDIQASDRAHRIGQTREVRVFYLCTLTPCEREMRIVRESKLRLYNLVIQSGHFDQTTSQHECEKKLREQIVLDTKLQPSNGHGADDETPTSDEEINRMLARSDEEFKIYEQMDKEIETEDQKEWARTHGTGVAYSGRFITEEELPQHVRSDRMELVEEVSARLRDSGRRGSWSVV